MKSVNFNTKTTITLTLLLLFVLSITGIQEANAQDKLRLQGIVIHEFPDKRPNGKYWDPGLSFPFSLPDVFARILYNGQVVKGESLNNGKVDKKFGKTVKHHDATFNHYVSFEYVTRDKPLWLPFEHLVYIDASPNGQYQVKLVDDDDGRRSNDTMIILDFDASNRIVSKDGFTIEVVFY